MTKEEIDFDVENAFSVIKDGYCYDKKTPYGVAHYKKIYRNTNEQLSTYLPSLVKYGSKVLSVSSSGDQYLSSILYGAGEVELFDINPISYYYSMLKICAATHLNYDEYIKFMVEGGEKNRFGYRPTLEKKYIKKIESLLPEDVANFYSKLNGLVNTMEYPNLDGLFYDSDLFFNVDTVSFYDKYLYEKLQERLKNIPYPKFYMGDIEQILPRIKSKYDLILLSNIKDFSINGFYDRNRKTILKKLNDGGMAQMDYVWQIATSHFKREKETIDRNRLESIIFPGRDAKWMGDKSYSNDGILLLKKTRN